MAADPPLNPVNDIVETVKAYALQETLGPLKDVGRFLAMGALASLFLGLGIVSLMLALLRLLQNHIHGNLSWIPYLASVALGAATMALAFSRIKKHGLESPEGTS